MTNPTPHGQVPAIQRYSIGYHSDEWGVRSLSPTGIYDDAGPWVRYEDHLAALVDAQQAAPSAASKAVLAAIRAANMQLVRTGDDTFVLVPYLQAHVQNQTEIEHVAGDVSKNGAEVNTNVYAELPPSYYLAGGVEKTWDQQQMHAFADATHALRAQQPAPDYEAGWKDGYKHGAWSTQQPAPATQQAGEVVAYLDIGAGGYLDLGSALSEDALQQLPKGRHALVIAGTYGIDGYVAAPQPSPTAPAAESVPAIQGEMNVQLGCGAEPPGIQALMCVISSLRDIAHFSDEEGGELMSALCALRDWAHAQTVAAPHPSPAAQADSVTAPAATPTAASIAWTALRDLTDPLGEAGVKIMGHVRIYAQRQYEAGLTEGRATPPAPAADSVLEDAARLDWLALAGPTSICLVIDRPHDGEVEVSTDDVTGYGKTLREALDAARKQGATP